ncbi:MAG: type III pantothenate kinase [Chloroflexota bacterium]
MLFAINIGNTNTTAAIFRDESPPLKKRVRTLPDRTPDEYAVLFDSLLRLDGINPRDISSMIVCSVVPRAQDALCRAAIEYWHLPPLVVTHQLDFGLELRYAHPERLGVDRLVNAAAAVHLVGCPAIVVDLGTATTVDAVTSDGAFAGGAIAPGLEVSERALFERTAQLPRVPLVAPGRYIGGDTVGSLQSGLLYGYAGLVDGLVDGFRAELGDRARVVATGGLATTVGPHARTIERCEPDLTLEGLRLIFERNRTHA